MKFIRSPGPGFPAIFVPSSTPLLSDPPRDPAPYVKQGSKQARDTVDGCRANARFDIAQAANMTSGNARLKYEHSAASWTERAELLQRIDDSHSRRSGAAAAT